MSIYSPSSPSTGVWSTRGGSSRRSSLHRNADPPRPAKDGFEWVWYPEGYWAERELQQRPTPRGPTQNRASKASVSRIIKWGSKPIRSPRAPPEPAELELDHRGEVSPMTDPSLSHFQSASIPHSPYLSESEQVAALQHPGQTPTPKLGGSQDTWTNLSPTSIPTVGLAPMSPGQIREPVVGRGAWKTLSTQMMVDASSKAKDVATQPIIQEAPSYFTQKPVRPRTRSSSSAEQNKNSTSQEPTSAQASAPSASPPKGLRKWLMRIPRSRKTPTTPASESVKHARFLLPVEKLPDTPLTPTSRDSFVAFNRPVPLPDTTISYPAGEAAHIETPPLKEETANGQPRSLFMELQHPLPLQDERTYSTDSTETTPRVFPHRRAQAPAQREWWDAPRAVVRRDPVRDVSFFEFDMPEHLPNSPMCPAHPKYKGKGKMVCVFHGRGKSVSMDEGIDLNESGDLDSLVEAE